MANSLKMVKAVLDNISNSNNFGQCLKKLEILSAGYGQCKAQFTVSDEHLNIIGSLHGGCTSTIVDCVSTYALMTHEKAANGGVSVDLHVTFMKAAFPGDVVTVDAKTLRAGKSLAFLTVELTKNDGKDLIARGQHTKFIK